MTLIYDVQVIPVIFIYNHIIFPITWWKNEENRWHSARDIRCFHVIMQLIFHLEKED